jgi:2-hydroxychromene-2-carboxylate isomerase
MRTAPWYFDFISPFAYLQWAQRAAFAGALELEPVPILFAKLLDHWGQKGPAEIAAKRTFTYQFVHWRARRAGVPLVFPPAHPFNPLAALRLCLAAGATEAAVDAIFAHVWRDGRAADTPDALAPVAAALGVADAAAATSDARVKHALRDHTERAIASGVYGVPTIALDGHLFWGEDATPMVLDYLAGRLDLGSPELRRVATLPQAAARGG